MPETTALSVTAGSTSPWRHGRTSSRIRQGVALELTESSATSDATKAMDMLLRFCVNDS